jgi:ribosomal protein S27AE
MPISQKRSEGHYLGMSFDNLFCGSLDTLQDLCPNCGETTIFVEFTPDVVVCDLCGAHTTWEEIEQFSDTKESDG